MIEVVDKALCCGCAACANVCPVACIGMTQDAEGSEYPSVDAELCIECGKCDTVCPILNVESESEGFQSAYIVQHRDSQILLESTSGGAFTAIAQACLSSGGIVYGASMQAGQNGIVPKVCHVGVETEGELWRFRNSKYTQSEIGLAMQEARRYLDDGRCVLFSGTPCQIEGLRRYLGKGYDNLLLLDFVCRAIPVRAAYNAYCQWLKGRTGEQASMIRFRDKRHYGYRYSQICGFSNSLEPFYSAGVESDPYLRAFYSGICNRLCCYSCVFKKRFRVSDITLWDCFNPRPFNDRFDNNKGCTFVLTHSDEGRRAMTEVERFADVCEIDADKAIRTVREMTQTIAYNSSRSEFIDDATLLANGSVYDKWFPDLLHIRLERFGRTALEKLGLYDIARRALNKAHLATNDRVR